MCHPSTTPPAPGTRHKRVLASLLLVHLLSVLFCLSGSAASPFPPLKVGVCGRAPFTMTNAAGEWTGFAIDVWRAVAATNGWTYTLIPLAGDDATNRMALGDVNVVLDIPMQADCDGIMDFCYPYAVADFMMAVKKQRDPNPLKDIVEFLFSWKFVNLFLLFLALIVPAGVVIVLLERRHDPGDFGGSWWKALQFGFFWSGTVLTTVAGEKNPRSTGARIFTLLWMFISVIAVGLFTAAMTKQFTAGLFTPSISIKADLADKKVGTLKGFEEDRLANLGAHVKFYPCVEAGLQAVNDEKIDAFVIGEAIMQYTLRTMDLDTIRLINMSETHEIYAFAVVKNSPLRAAINTPLLLLRESREWLRMYNLYFTRK